MKSLKPPITAQALEDEAKPYRLTMQQIDDIVAGKLKMPARDFHYPSHLLVVRAHSLRWIYSLAVQEGIYSGDPRALSRSRHFPTPLAIELWDRIHQAIQLGKQVKFQEPQTHNQNAPEGTALEEGIAQAIPLPPHGAESPHQDPPYLGLRPLKADLTTLHQWKADSQAPHPSHSEIPPTTSSASDTPAFPSTHSKPAHETPSIHSALHLQAAFSELDALVLHLRGNASAHPFPFREASAALDHLRAIRGYFKGYQETSSALSQPLPSPQPN